MHLISDLKKYIQEEGHPFAIEKREERPFLQKEEPEKEKYVTVLLDTGVPKPLDYSLPKELHITARIGMRVKVPLKGQLQSGTLIAFKESPSYSPALPLAELLEEQHIPEELFQLALWMQKYYLTPLRSILRLMLPSSLSLDSKSQFFVTRLLSPAKLRKVCEECREAHPMRAEVLDLLLQQPKGMFLSEIMEKTGCSRSPIDTLVKEGILDLKKVVVDRSPLQGESYFKSKPKNLTEEQKTTLEKIYASLSEKKFVTHLVHGVTGSGKTEIYLSSIEKALSYNLGVIMLVPEISLTPQTIERFRSRFENDVAILHHRLSAGQRRDEWHRIRKGLARIVIGTRSALFSPMPHLGLIIVDEEHDGAYKQQEERPTYHARDMAVMRGVFSESVVILGSATPSLESYYNAKKGKYLLSTLHARATGKGFPEVTIVDMKNEFEKAKGYTSFSELLLEKIKKRIEVGEQSLLFLNRRGYHTSMRCSCGHIFTCPHCDLPLTFHLGEKTLACHLCDFRISPLPQLCPSCKVGRDFAYKGVGTEQLQKALHAIFPSIKTVRIDGDTTRHKGSHEQLFRQVKSGKADVMIGTQMIAKGLHFPLVTLVAILNADSSLNIPDFRASEQTFQLITQVAGRAGRGDLPGEVIIQTQTPSASVIQLAASQNYEAFYEKEIEARKLFGFPPFTHLAKFTFSHENAALAESAGKQFRKQLGEKLSGCIIHPLVPSGHPKVRDLFRFQFLVRGSIPKINEVVVQLPPPQEVKLQIDIDSLSTFF